MNSKIIVVVTTHSPFLLKGIIKSSYHNHRVYALDDCKLMDLTGKGNVTQANNGVNGIDAVICANKLLGSGVDDLLPSPLIFAENSIVKLIQKLNEKLNLKIRHKLISVGGGDATFKSRMIGLTTMASIFHQMNAVYPERELFHLRMIFITDDKSQEKILQSQILSNLEGEQTISVKSIGSQQLEDVYPLQFVNDFLYDKGSADHEIWDQDATPKINNHLKAIGILAKDRGKIKADMAESFVDTYVKNRNYLLKNCREIHELIEYLQQPIIH